MMVHSEVVKASYWAPKVTLIEDATTPYLQLESDEKLYVDQ